VCVGGGAGFSSFDTEDQITIVRLGQSSSRVLVAALHWFDADRRTFRNFLSWRAGGAERGRTAATAAATGLDLFKQQLVRFSETVIALELDPVEAAMLNVLLVTASGMRTARAEWHNSAPPTRRRDNSARGQLDAGDSAPGHFDAASVTVTQK